MAKSYRARIQRRRRQLFHKQKGRCYWCQCQMQLEHEHRPHATMPKDLCTLDHLYDRLNPKRLEDANGEQRYVAACWECNHRRGREAQAALPIVELWKRSGSPPATL